MGKSTRFFKQSKRSMKGNDAARSFSQINRGEGARWHVRILNFLKVRGKGN